MSGVPALLTTGVLAAALGAGALGAASAAAPTPSSAASPSKSGATSDTGATSHSAPPSDPAPAKHSRHVGKGLERRVLHGEFVVRQRDGFVTIALQRGDVTAISATSITVKSNDGFSRSYVINAETKSRAHGRPAVRQLTVGERAMVRAKRTGATFTALRIARLQPHGQNKVKPNRVKPAEPAPLTSG